MSAAPWMPLYVADYLSDTAHLSAAEHGAYLLLIMHYWRAGKLPTDERQLLRIARMTPRQWGDSRAVIAEFFNDDWTHDRIESELINSRKKTTIRSEAGARGGAAKALKNNNAGLANATILLQQNDKQNDAFALASSSQSQSESKNDVSLRSTSSESVSAHENSNPEAKPLEKPESLPPEKPERPPDKTRGCRVPENWHPGSDWLEFTRAEGLTDEQANRALVEFHDYWRGIPGHRGVKLDWLATWKNRVRQISTRGQRQPFRSQPGGGRAEPTSTLELYQRAAARFHKPDDFPGGQRVGEGHNGPILELPVTRSG